MGPIDALDAAIAAVRRAGLPFALRCWLAGGVVGWVALAAYYFERVEGVIGLRPAIAIALVLSFWLRAHLLAHASQTLLLPLLPEGSSLAKPRFIEVARTASIVALGLWAWSFLLVLGSLFSAITVALLSLFFCVRGAVAPTWIARAGVETRGGFPTFRLAFDDMRGVRVPGLVSELALLSGQLVLFFSLGLALSIAVTLLRSMLGLDVALIEGFLTFRNDFMVLCLGVVAIVAMEPIRVGLSVIRHIDSRTRREGYDLAASIAALSRLGTRARDALLLLLALGLSATLFSSAAFAQPWSEGPMSTLEDAPAAAPSEPIADPAIAQWDDADRRARARAQKILARSEFRELSADDRGRTIREWVEAFFDWLLGDVELPEPEGSTRSDGPHLPMPPAWVFITLALVVLVLALAFTFPGRGEEERGGSDASTEDESQGTSTDPRDRAPEEHVGEAARLAAEGRHREALRALYLATLVALDRKGAIRFERTRTNWHYLRSISDTELRERFRELTFLFDLAWYGEREGAAELYERGRLLVDEIRSVTQGEPA